MTRDYFWNFTFKHPGKNIALRIIIKAGRLTLEEDMEIEVMQEASVDNYAKYLPRKKKK